MLTDTLKSYLSFFGNDPYLQALVVILFSFILARVSRTIIIRGLLRIASRTRSDVDDQILSLLRRPVFWSVVLVGLFTALGLISIPETPKFIIKGTITTLIVFLWASFGVQLSSLLLRWMSAHADRFEVIQTATLPLFDIVAKVVLVGASLYFVLLTWKVNISGWLASAGILGLAVGLAAQETLSNLFAGLSILTDAPYRVGDYIVLDVGERGRVVKIGLRSTRILTRDDIEITVPNSVIAKSKIVNESGGPSIRHRIRVPFGVAYGSDVDRVKELVSRIAGDNKYICPQPSPWVQFRRFGDSSLDFELRCWIEDPASRGRALDSLNTEIYKTLNREGIEIPFPKRDLYLKEVPPQLAAGTAGEGPSPQEERPQDSPSLSQ